MKDYKGCIADMTKAIQLMPISKNSFYYRGLSYQKIANISKACSDLHVASEMGYGVANPFLQKWCTK